jgi:phosphate transport system permease protein
MTVAPPTPPRRAFSDVFGDTPKARRRIAWLRRLDGLAAAGIKSGGILIILAVFAIFVFIGKEAIPLFLPEKITPRDELAIGGGDPNRPLAVGEDEYREKGWALGSRGTIRLLDFVNGRIAEEIPLEDLGDSTILCGARSGLSDVLAAGTDDGRVFLAAVEYEPVFRDGRRVEQTIRVAWQLAFTMREDGGPIERLAVSGDGSSLVVAATGKGFLGIATKKRIPKNPKVGDASEALEGRDATALALDETGENLVIGFDDGTGLRLALDGVDATREERFDAGGAPITAMTYVLGSRSLLIGDAEGAVSGWQGVRSDAGNSRTLSRVRNFAPMDAAVVAFAPSRRDKTFLIVDRAGDVRLDHLTTERTIGSLAGVAPGATGALAPKADGGLVISEAGDIRRFDEHSDHPESSWRALFLPMLYEGYDSPDYIWQSTGGTDDFEPKYSLVPLIFGSLKGVFYAMLFSVPIAILAALFVSQFASTRLRGVIKPTVELMGALPSVVVGFLAGLWLSPLIDQELMTTFLLLAALPISILVAGLVFRALPNQARQRFVLGRELRFTIPFIVLGALAAIAVAHPLEAVLFSGDIRRFLVDSLGVPYDARNSVVVGIALGFAVIPIIFTVAEDAMSNVPRALRAASDALGASRWQTAFRLVLPAASPGIFAALMLGFGRAVGETMIVLMATGNTPILDPSPFNGMRTISACIAVEMPEAPEGGTHARILFFAGALLFVFAFVANTAAEVVGERLRKRFARW